MKKRRRITKQTQKAVPLVVLTTQQYSIGRGFGRGVGNAEILVNGKLAGTMRSGECDFDPVRLKKGDVLEMRLLDLKRKKPDTLG